MSLHHNRLEKILKETPVLVACLSGDPDYIIGYAFEDGDKPFHYLRLAWREESIGAEKLLLKHLKENHENQD